MIFRTNEGKLVQLIKYNFINDKLYYQKILEINKPLPKLENTFNYKNNHEHFITVRQSCCNNLDKFFSYRFSWLL